MTMDSALPLFVGFIEGLLIVSSLWFGCASAIALPSRHMTWRTHAMLLALTTLCAAAVLGLHALLRLAVRA